MASITLSAAGSALASSTTSFAGTIGANLLGSAFALAGSYVGGLIDNSLFGSNDNISQEGTRLQDLNVQSSAYGKVIPNIYGRARLAGNVIWSSGISEEKVTSESDSGGKGSGSTSTTVSYNYYSSLAIAICEGEVSEVVRVWADSKLLTSSVLGSSDDKYNIYHGTETQTADPIMESHEGSGNVPAYRGICYVVIKDFPLAAFGNRVPNFTFEILRNVQKSPTLEESIKELVIIPGSGEYVYDTDIVTKTPGYKLSDGSFSKSASNIKMNMHNFDNIADVKKSLDNMERAFPNLEKISLVVSWFSTSKFLATSRIIPKVEEDDSSAIFSSSWEVGSYDRTNAETIAIRSDGSLNYGGTPSDKSVINLCQELNARGYGIMFYPFLAIDTTGEEGGGEESKPWRGRMVPTSSSELNTWMSKSEGYNNYIAHYAVLSVDGVALKDLIDKFVIGSEMKGITQYSSSTGVYPGVTQFKILASTIKTTLGSGVEVGYAADWSEYHSVDGWFNMDPLWTDSNIDFIGIDYYMPLTPDLPQSAIEVDTIKQYIQDGEGWEYYYTDSEARTGKTDFTPNDGTSPYAWKNIESWWSTSTHENPDMSNNWTSKPKKLIFTEFGFPSTDCCANQPNVFVDVNSVESSYPRESRRRVGYSAQRDAIQAMIEFWQAKNTESGNANLVPEMYLWTWDARPYPFFPDISSFWGDAVNWKTGHWVNGKLGGCNLGAIIAELLTKVGFSSSDYNVDDLNEIVEGFVISETLTVRNALDQLGIAFFFDMVESSGVLKFVRRGVYSSPTNLDTDDFIPNKNSNSEVLVSVSRTQELELIKELTINFIDRTKSYENNSQMSLFQVSNSIRKNAINIPIVLSEQEAKNIADKNLYLNWVSRNKYSFSISNKYIDLEPTDVVSFIINGATHVVRIVSMDISPKGVLKCEGVSEDQSVYDFYRAPGSSETNENSGYELSETNMILLDLPTIPGNSDSGSGILRAALYPGDLENWDGSVVYRSSDGGESGGNTWETILTSNDYSTVGTLLTNLGPGITTGFDLENVIDIFWKIGETNISSVSELALLNGANSIIIGSEIIQFQTVTVLDSNPNTLRLSKLLRGRLGTEFSAETTKNLGLDVIFISTSLEKINVALSNFNLQRYYKPVSVGEGLSLTDEQSFTYTGIKYRPYSVCKLTGFLDGSDWDISWVRRTRYGGELKDGTGETPLNEEFQKYEIDIMSGSTVLNTYTSTSESFTYTSAQQTSDFGSTQSTLKVRVYQISSIYGRGIVKEETFTS